jgi:hypothetical protein
MRPTDIRKDWSLDYASTIHHIVHQSNEETYQNEVKKVCTECRTAHHMFERTHHQRCAHLITPAQKQVLTNQKTGSSTGWNMLSEVIIDCYHCNARPSTAKVKSNSQDYTCTCERQQEEMFPSFVNIPEKTVCNKGNYHSLIAKFY